MKRLFIYAAIVAAISLVVVMSYGSGTFLISNANAFSNPNCNHNCIPCFESTCVHCETNCNIPCSIACINKE